MRTTTYVLLILAAFLLVYCNRETSLNQSGHYLNLQDSVQYVGMETCRSCHADIHSTFIHTGMGRSFDWATKAKTAATYGKHALVYDSVSNLYYQPYFQQDTLFINEFRLNGTDTIHQRTERISYIIGSGQHTNSHILNINGYIYQAPITFYTQEGKWDMAPGFKGDNERFDRFLTSECITCHNHLPKEVEGSLNKFSAMPRGIECERCHGPGEIHVQEKLAGKLVDTAKFIDYTIVNPVHLPRDLQMDLCQRCHLQGIAVLNEGKTFYDFKPGMKLNEVLNVFLPRYTNSHEKFIMASQADRLRLSECYKQSDMTCLTCHNPHKSVEVTGKTHFNAKCQTCHNQPPQTLCTLSAAEQAVEENGCVGCHMPRSGSIDIPHVNITDHYIGKEKEKEAGVKDKAAFLGLQILTTDNPTPLDMARGYLAMYDKYVASPIMLDSAKYYLDKSDMPLERKLEPLTHYYFNQNDYPNLIQLAKKFPPEQLSDGWTAYRMGEGFFHTQDYANAQRYFFKAAQIMPYNLDFQEKLGATYVLLQELAKAKTTLEFVLNENPKRKVALMNLGYVYALQGDLPQGEQLYDKAIALDPDYEQALLNKAAIRLHLKDKKTARQLLERVLKINPQNAQAQAVFPQLENFH